MVDILDKRLLHPEEIRLAQERCISKKSEGYSLEKPDAAWAADYFCCSWMGRGGMSGTKDEFKQGVSIRYTSSGGSSVKRFRSAIESMGEWVECLKNWEFSCIDAMKFIDKSHDKDQHGIYADPPWPEDGDRYSVVFTEEDQRSLASKLSSLENSKVVVRYGDHPLIRELYKEDRWTWIEQDSRSQSNDKVSEVLLLLRNRSLS